MGEAVSRDCRRVTRPRTKGVWGPRGAATPHTLRFMLGAMSAKSAAERRSTALFSASRLWQLVSLEKGLLCWTGVPVQRTQQRARVRLKTNLVIMLFSPGGHEADLRRWAL